MPNPRPLSALTLAVIGALALVALRAPRRAAERVRAR
jgi:hypothetical protein